MQLHWIPRKVLLLTAKVECNVSSNLQMDLCKATVFADELTRQGSVHEGSYLRVQNGLHLCHFFCNVIRIRSGKRKCWFHGEFEIAILPDIE